MQAAMYDTSGDHRGALYLTEIPDPWPAPGEVRVRIHVSGVNPTDWKARESGNVRVWAQQIPNQDGAGLIDAVGDGVDESRVGQRVWVYHAADRRPSGTAAQYVCLPEEQAVRLPEDTSLELGASLGIPGITAHHCLLAHGPVSGKTVLVTGGAGAVGNMAIQLARHNGARVVATVSSEHKAKLATSAGAHTVLNYRSPTFATELSAAADAGIDRVIEVAPSANIDSYATRLNSHAVVATYARDQDTATVQILPLMRANVLLRFVLVYDLSSSELQEATVGLTQALEEGALRPLPLQRFPLEAIADAHEAVRAGAVGKVLIDIP